MYRQLAHVFMETPRGSLGPAVGSEAAEFAYLRVSDNSRHVFTPSAEPALLAFVDPSCLSCEALVKTMEKLRAAGALAEVRTLLMISDPPEYLQISQTFQTTQLEIGRPESAVPREAYNAIATPLLIAIDRSGVVRAARAGATESRDVRMLRDAAIAPPLQVVAPSEMQEEDAATVVEGNGGGREADALSALAVVKVSMEGSKDGYA